MGAWWIRACEREILHPLRLSNHSPSEDAAWRTSRRQLNPKHCVCVRVVVPQDTGGVPDEVDTNVATPKSSASGTISDSSI
eukprot:4293286-Amphidinium_carterae.1